MLAPRHCVYSRETWILLWSSCSDSLWESGLATLADTVASFFAYFFRDLRSAKWQGDKRWQPVESLLCLCLKELFFLCNCDLCVSQAYSHENKKQKYIGVSKAEEWKVPLPFPLHGYRVNLDVMYSVMYSLPIQMDTAFWRRWTQPHKILYLAGAVTVSKRPLCCYTTPPV